MGASASTNKQTIENTMINNAYNSCGTIGAVNNVTINDITFDPPANCNPPSSFDISQATTINSKCLIASLQSSAAQTVAQLSAEAKAGLGFSASTNINDITNTIKNNVTNKCANQSTTNKANLKDMVIKSCNIRIAQDATVNEVCQINETQNEISNIADKAAANAQGGSILGDIFGSGITKIIIAIIILIALLGGGFFLFKQLTKNKNTAPVETATELNKSAELAALLGGNISNAFNNLFSSNPKENRTIIIIIILVLVILVALIVYNHLEQSRKERERKLLYGQ
ncbi:IMV envelope protein [Moumouvirus goulette]|uniref:IMV envelope protein n=1 Tax=Moumouvirus goulette TaxID=1247379 RepID=M1PWU4_9VIRU|nr:IMV envelope protein [Moumouvirus goulette]AGF85232.1 IMV envelope protein [Moumouvirus goulette]